MGPHATCSRSSPAAACLYRSTSANRLTTAHPLSTEAALDTGGTPPGAVRSTSLVGASLVVWGIGSYAYYLIAGRLVGPSVYGLVSALIAVLAIIGWACLAVQWAMARTVATHLGTDRPGTLAVYRRAIIRSGVISVVAAALATGVTLGLAAAGETVPMWPLIATYVSAVPVLPLYVALGALQGEHRYTPYAVSYAITGVLRAVLVLPLVLLPVVGAGPVVVANGVAAFAGLAVAAWLSRADLRVRTPPPDAIWRSMTAGLGATVVGLLGFASLFGLGVIAARLRFPSVDAGYFGAVGVLAHAMIIVPQALTIVLLPRVAARRSRDVPTGALLGAAVGVTVAIGVVVAIACAFLGEQVMRITFGPAYAAAGDLLPQYVLASTLIGALFVLVNHHVARSDHRFSWLLGGVAIVHVVLLVLLGSTANAIIGVDALAALIGLIGHEWLYRGTGDSLLTGTRMALSSTRAVINPRGARGQA